MKLQALGLLLPFAAIHAPQVSAGGDFTTTSTVVTPCDFADFVTDCLNQTNQLCSYYRDDYCDNGGFYITDFNCAEFNYDGGDCNTVPDCDGNERLRHLIGDGVCTDGTETSANFNCVAFNFDEGDCPITDCDGACLDEYNSPDWGDVCREEFNCKKFGYDEFNCVPLQSYCTDDWYTLGREGYRCSTRSGATRFANMKVEGDFDACECYSYCSEKAENKGLELTAIDEYSGKCRCWAGDCNPENTRECREDRCPSNTYFITEQEDDCLGTHDVTLQLGTYRNQYYNDGFCDNRQFGWTDTATVDYGSADHVVGDYNCSAFGNDGTDCEFATCDDRFVATNFATLREANTVCDGHLGQFYHETEWTTACECYDACNTNGDSTEVIFQRSKNNMCQCVSECTSVTNCGLESDCQIFTVNPVYDCCGNDWTTGKTVQQLSELDLGEFSDAYSNSLEFQQAAPKVLSLEAVRDYANDFELCIPELFCSEYQYSTMYSDNPADSPCFDCAFSSEEQLKNATTENFRCDQRQGAERYDQMKDYYSPTNPVPYSPEPREPTNLTDFCTCNKFCSYRKFLEYYNTTCANTAFQEYEKFFETQDIAIDAYKGDCRCWDNCNPDTLWECTGPRCDDGPVAVVLFRYQGQIVSPPDVRGGGR